MKTPKNAQSIFTHNNPTKGKKTKKKKKKGGGKKRN